ncbi:hypothetical protein LJC32_02735 [Oscillospiraceae bacterium OttesenSCG-928-F05]|nr:hypothetical protein [Oscillospiraceae bacterium OttesenSCG-928-F05]
MAALTSGRNTPEFAEAGRLLVLPVAADAVIYEGSIVVLDATGYAKPATKAADLTAAGRAETFVDNRGGAAGEKTVEVARGVFLWDNSATNKVKPEHLLKPCYILDDQTVTSLETGSSVAGKVVSITDDQVAVEIR